MKKEKIKWIKDLVKKVHEKAIQFDDRQTVLDLEGQALAIGIANLVDKVTELDDADVYEDLAEAQAILMEYGYNDLNEEKEC